MACDIFLIEDNSDDVFLIREALEAAKFHHQLRHHHGGAAAAEDLLSALRAPKRPDVLILDYHLPGWTAPELLASFHPTGVLDSTTVIVFGGSIPPESTVMLRSMGTDKVLVKPFDLDSYLSLGAVIRDTCLSGT